jgi:hypothetical protein
LRDVARISGVRRWTAGVRAAARLLARYGDARAFGAAAVRPSDDRSLADLRSSTGASVLERWMALVMRESSPAIPSR